MKRISTIVPLLMAASLLLAACGGGQQASAHLEAIKKTGKIQVGTAPDYPPFESVDANGNYVGFDIELMGEVAKRMGVELVWVEMPFDSLIAAVQEGKIDMSISAFNYSAERDQKVDFSEAYFTSEDALAVIDGFTGQINTPEDITSYNVGVKSGTTQDAWLTENLIDTGLLPESNLFRYDWVDQSMLDLKAGRIDVVMLDYLPAMALAGQLGGITIIWHGVYSNGSVNMVIPEGDQGLQQELNQIIAALQNEGFIDQLAIKYFGS